MTGALVAFALAYGLVLLFALRRPLLRRLAVREAVRRRGQSLLVVAGLMVGTATITGALIGADSVGDSAVDSFAYRNWWHVDLTVTSGNRAFSPQVAERLAEHPGVRGVTDGVSAGIELVGSAANLDERRGASGVVLIGFDPAAQRAFDAYELLDGRRTFGEDLARNEVLISRTLADKVGAQAGHRLRVTVESGDGMPEPRVVRVAGVARGTGPGAHTLTSAIFAPLRTAQRIAGMEGINIIRISAPGGVYDNLQAGRDAVPVIERALVEMEPATPLHVSAAKAKEVENAETFTSFIQSMLTGMSAIVIAAGAALIINLMGMLAEERRTQMGVLRALGLRRRRLIGLSVIEGALYTWSPVWSASSSGSVSAASSRPGSGTRSPRSPAMTSTSCSSSVSSRPRSCRGSRSARC